MPSLKKSTKGNNIMNRKSKDTDFVAASIEAYAEDAERFKNDILIAQKRLYKRFGKQTIDALLTESHGRSFTDLLHIFGLTAHANELVRLKTQIESALSVRSTRKGVRRNV